MVMPARTMQDLISLRQFSDLLTFKLFSCFFDALYGKMVLSNRDTRSP